MIRRPEQRETSLKSEIPIVLTIAGSDNSGGAGLQADLKTFTTLGVYGTTAVTCVVAEHPGRVLNITPLSPQRVTDQIKLVLEAFPVAALKTGLLHSAEIIRAVDKAVQPALNRGVPLVMDPVMVASTGKVLMSKKAFHALRDFLPQARLVTPNRDELAILAGRTIKNFAQLRDAALELLQQLHGPALLAKGGHFHTPLATDLLVLPNGKIHSYQAPRVAGLDPHGTGCTYSAAITAHLALGKTLPQAVAQGKRFITRAIQQHFTSGAYVLLNTLP